MNIPIEIKNYTKMIDSLKFMIELAKNKKDIDGENGFDIRNTYPSIINLYNENRGLNCTRVDDIYVSKTNSRKAKNFYIQSSLPLISVMDIHNGPIVNEKIKSVIWTNDLTNSRAIRKNSIISSDVNFEIHIDNTSNNFMVFEGKTKINISDITDEAEMFQYLLMNLHVPEHLFEIALKAKELIKISDTIDFVGIQAKYCDELFGIADLRKEFKKNKEI